MFRILLLHSVAAITVLTTAASFGDSPSSSEPSAAASAPDGWATFSPRDEIRPRFAFDSRGGRDSKGSFVIEADGRKGLHGCWTKTFPIAGGHVYQFQAFRKAINIPSPRRSALVKVTWLNTTGKMVVEDRPLVT